MVPLGDFGEPPTRWPAEGEEKGKAVGVDQLICANCSGRVVEGRCPSCREARADLQQSSRNAALVYALLALLTLFGLVFGLVRSFA